MHTDFARRLLDPHQKIPADVVSRIGADPVRRFNVHRNNVMLSLIEALQDTFPVVASLVGSEFFHYMAHCFVQKNPPQSPILVEYGHQFPDFIKHFEAVKTLPYLPEVAQLEWQRVISWHAAESRDVVIEEIISLLEKPDLLGSSIWEFKSSVQIVRSPFAIVSLWLLHQSENTLDDLAKINITSPESALIFRQSQNVIVRPITLAEYAFIEALYKKTSLTEAVSAGESVTASFDVSFIFAMLLEIQALSDFSIKQKDTE
ncbi:HvfC/BufC family peptide modification chaperone [Aquaspirillum soli]